jgi:hypothetical protein
MLLSNLASVATVVIEGSVLMFLCPKSDGIAFGDKGSIDTEIFLPFCSQASKNSKISLKTESGSIKVCLARLSYKAAKHLFA